MLKKLILNNWKSFQEAELEINALTILIGTNASGKSNALDALAFLNRTVQGIDLQSALAGDNKMVGIRGGIEWAVLKPNTQFTLQVLVGTDDDRTDYLYSIAIETIPRVQLVEESLDRIRGQRTLRLFWTDKVSSDKPSITSRLYNTSRGTPQEMNRYVSLLSQLKIIRNKNIRKEITEGIEIVSQVLNNIFILDPLPSRMRDYSPLTENLYSDASNLAGVLAALKADKKAEIEETIATYITKLPEKDVRKVWAETVGKFNTDAMLYCEEFWVSEDHPTIVDARGMSDGTLRFLAILTALLTQPKGSQIVIEEVDNGLHPSRSNLLLKMLLEISEEREIDVLVTTHNPALLDQLPLELVPDVVVAHRNPQTGSSELTLLEDLKNLPKLMAFGSLGKVTSQGLIEQSFQIN